MDERYLSFSEETNALDYLERAAQFIREAATNDAAWKWTIIALHGALYGFAICACKGTDWKWVTHVNKKGVRKLISFGDALNLCQDPQRMQMTVHSKPLVLTKDQRAAIKELQEEFRNPLEHYIPTIWDIEVHGMPTLSIHCLEVIRFLALETGNYAMFSNEQLVRVKDMVAESISFLSTLPLHTEYLSGHKEWSPAP